MLRKPDGTWIIAPHCGHNERIRRAIIHQASWSFDPCSHHGIRWHWQRNGPYTGVLYPLLLFDDGRFSSAGQLQSLGRLFRCITDIEPANLPNYTVPDIVGSIDTRRTRNGRFRADFLMRLGAVGDRCPGEYVDKWTRPCWLGSHAGRFQWLIESRLKAVLCESYSMDTVLFSAPRTGARQRCCYLHYTIEESDTTWLVKL